MVIVGLGSNIDDRLTHLRKAWRAIKKIPGFQIIATSPIYLSDALLPEHAPKTWDRPYLNLALRGETTLDAFSLLNHLKRIEEEIGRKPEKRHWGPRIIDIDILVFGDEVIKTDALTVPHQNLYDRPFALWPLADVAPFWKIPLTGEYHGNIASALVEKWGSRFTGDAPLHTRQIYHRIDTPQLVGVLNVTPDSFSDGGKFLSAEHAIQQAQTLIQSGAEILDIGAQSTAPNAPSLDSETEWNRLEPVLLALKENKNNFIIQPKISIDTYHPQVAEKAFDLGMIDMLNDVTGLTNPHLCDFIRNTPIDAIFMHHVSIPADAKKVLSRDQDVINLVYEWAAKQLDWLKRQGIEQEKLIFDPGIGFGKTKEQSLMLIKHAARFKELGTRLLIGHSRKSFLSLLTPYEAADRDIETLILTIELVKQEAIDYLRVHHVEKNARALRVTRAML